jgi:hypothetical protein
MAAGGTHIRIVDDLPDVVSAQGLTSCIVNDCATQKIVGRGRCRRHYMQWWRRTRGQERPPALNLKTLTPEQRFWLKVDKRGPDECWPWTSSKHESGHGEFFVSKERGKAPSHSYALELATGEKCPAGKECCHHCDNPPCCNPEHLYFGTRMQNVHDAISRRRHSHGSRHRGARLTEADVVAIRTRFAAGETQPSLSAEFGISSGHISHIVNGRIWKYAGGPTKTHNKPGRRFPRKDAA